jgi:hypothetical protein
MAIYDAVKAVWSWTSVGWFVALFIGVWGALLGTGDFRIAVAILILTGLIVGLKCATACLNRRPKLRLLFVIGELVLITAVIWMSRWTHSKDVQAKERQRYPRGL